VEPTFRIPTKLKVLLPTLMDWDKSTQTVDVHAGGAGQDLVQLTEYDDHGRAVKQYLPLPVNGGKGDYNTGVATATATYYGAGNRAYSQTVYEPCLRVEY
jgi:hypothetical protein